MRAMLRFVVIFFVLALFLNAFSEKASAQSTSITPNYRTDTSPAYTSLIQDSFYASDPKYFDGNTLSATISISDITGNYLLCGYSNADIKDCIFNESFGLGSGDAIYTVCGDGKDNLKGFPKGAPPETYECDDDGSDYFHEGHIYRLGVFSDEAKGGLALAEFYVKHTMPWVQIRPQNEMGPTNIDVTLWGRRPGKNDKNNYQIIIEGVDNVIKAERCVTVRSDDKGTYPAGYQKDPENGLDGGGTTVEMFPRRFINDNSPFPPGKYVVKINEQVDEGGFLGLGVSSTCTGGFTYMHIPVTIYKDASYVVGRPQTNRVNDNIDFDPNESDQLKEYDLFGSAFAPCATWDQETDECTHVNTAIDALTGGPLNVTTEGFVGGIFKLVLTLAGFGAILVIIYAGYTFMTSRGDKEKIAGARETITSAVVGLLFIILSVVILEIIGIDILQIPGLTR